jgi:hypothetical protein
LLHVSEQTGASSGGTQLYQTVEFFCVWHSCQQFTSYVTLLYNRRCQVVNTAIKTRNLLTTPPEFLNFSSWAVVPTFNLSSKLTFLMYVFVSNKQILSLNICGWLVCVCVCVCFRCVTYNSPQRRTFKFLYFSHTFVITRPIT